MSAVCPCFFVFFCVDVASLGHDVKGDLFQALLFFQIPYVRGACIGGCAIDPEVLFAFAAIEYIEQRCVDAIRFVVDAAAVVGSVGLAEVAPLAAGGERVAEEAKAVGALRVALLFGHSATDGLLAVVAASR